MNYQVWTKDEYEGWKRADCPDIETVKASVLAAIKTGKDPLVTVEVPFDVNIKIKEGKIGETTESEAKPDKGARGTSHGEVRRGDEKTPPGLDKGSGHSSADHSAGN